MTLDDALEELLRAPLAEFVATRNRLADALEEAGRADDARALRALRKPPLVVWAVDQLAHRSAADVRRLLDAARALQDASREALARGSGAALRAAQTEERQAVATLVRRAEEVLRDHRHNAGPQVARRLAQALHSAAVGDDALRSQLEHGRLTSEPKLTGALVPSGTNVKQLTERAHAARRRAERALERANELRRRQQERREALEEQLARAERTAARLREELAAETRPQPRRRRR